MNIGQKIKHARTKKGLTQKQLGEKLGSTQQMIAQYESGKHTPKIDTLNHIAEALDVSLADLLSSNILNLTDSVIDLFSDGNAQYLGTSTPDSSQERYLISQFRELNDKGKKKATDYVDDLIQIPKYKKE